MQVIDDFKYPGQIEADSKIAFFLAISNAVTAVIRCADTDILIIILGNIRKFSNIKIWIDFGIGKDQLYINVTGTY